MATTEQLDVVIKTIADTTGAQQVSQSLQQTQRAASGVQQQLSSSQQGANAIMRGAMAQGQATLANFERLRESVRQSTGVAPTLTARDFGIQAALVTSAARTAATATAAVGEASSITGQEVARLGFAFLGAGVGLSVFTAAGQLAHQVVSSFVTDTIGLDQAARDNTIALGQQAAGYQAWAASASQAAGVTQQSLLEAGTAAAQFSRQVGLGPEATTQLTALATVLARIHGTDVGQTMTELTAAIQGNAGAANALGLQLDAATISYTQFGDATGQVFNQLDPSTQAALRYEAALGQLHNQLGGAVGPVQDLQRAQGELNTGWEHFATATGPGVIGLLAKITGGAGAALEAWNKLVASQAQQREANPRESIQSDLGRLGQFAGEQAQGVLDRLGQQTAQLRGERGQEFSDLGTRAKELNDQLRDTTGFDAQATAANAMAAAVEKAQQAVDAVKSAAMGVGSALVQPWESADAAMRRTAADAMTARDAQLAAAVARVAEPMGAQKGAQANEIAAAQALVQIQAEKNGLLGDEAAIRLTMLPAQQQMLELQNQTNRAQIEATQRSLPAQRGLQDLQTQIEQQRLIAQSGFRSMEERQAALRTGAALSQQVPEAQLAAARAQSAALPAQRAAQDVGLVGQLQALDLQQALFPDQFRVDQLTLLGTIADAAKQSAARDIAAINVTVGLDISQTAGPLTADDEKRIVQLTSDEFGKQLHQALVSVDGRGAAPSLLLGAGH